MAVYEASNDAPGRRLGASELLATGEHDDIEVELTESPEPGSDLFLMLHGEGGGDADLQHPGPDEPLADDGRILTIRITVE